MADTMLDVVDYTHFKKKCYELDSLVAEDFLVRSIVTEALTWLWHCSNPRLVADTVASNRDAIEFFKKRLSETDDPKKIKAIEGCIAMAQEAIDSADQRQESDHELYTEFCETVILSLAMEGRKMRTAN